MIIDRFLGTTRFFSPPGEGDPPAEVKVENQPEVKGEVENQPEVKVEGSEGEAKAEGAEGEAKPEVKVEEKVPPKRDWREDRIARLTAQLSEAKGKLAEKPVVDGGLPETEVERRAQIRARAIAEEQAFNNACNAAADQGKKEFPDFEEKIGNLVKALAPQSDPEAQQSYLKLVAATMETDAPAKVLHALGGDLNEAARIMALSPIKMATEIVKLANKVPEEISKTPKPIITLGGRGASHSAIEPDDPDRGGNLTTAEWMARRQKQVDTRRGPLR